MQTFDEYQEFVNSMKVYPEKHAIVYPALGLAGESGEIAEKIKKFLRGDTRSTEELYGTGGDYLALREDLLKELGDPLWYITSLAADLGYTLQDVVDANEAKLTSRKERGVLKGSGDNR